MKGSNGTTTRSKMPSVHLANEEAKSIVKIVQNKEHRTITLGEESLSE